VSDRRAELERRHRQHAEGQLRLPAPPIRTVVEALQPQRGDVEIKAIPLGGHGVLDARRTAGVEVVVVCLSPGPMA
jgi:hypothetical protein